MGFFVSRDMIFPNANFPMGIFLSRENFFPIGNPYLQDGIFHIGSEKVRKVPKSSQSSQSSQWAFPISGKKFFPFPLFSYRHQGKVPICT